MASPKSASKSDGGWWHSLMDDMGWGAAATPNQLPIVHDINQGAGLLQRFAFPTPQQVQAGDSPYSAFSPSGLSAVEQNWGRTLGNTFPHFFASPTTRAKPSTRKSTPPPAAPNWYTALSPFMQQTAFNNTVVPYLNQLAKSGNAQQANFANQMAAIQNMPGVTPQQRASLAGAAALQGAGMGQATQGYLASAAAGPSFDMGMQALQAAHASTAAIPQAFNFAANLGLMYGNLGGLTGGGVTPTSTGGAAYSTPGAPSAIQNIYNGVTGGRAPVLPPPPGPFPTQPAVASPRNTTPRKK